MDEAFGFSNRIGQLPASGLPVAFEASTVDGYCLASVDDVGDEITLSRYRGNSDDVFAALSER